MIGANLMMPILKAEEFSCEKGRKLTIEARYVTL